MGETMSEFTAYEMLRRIIHFGELCNLPAGDFYPPGGKKPSSKDMFAFPRHMLTEIEAVLAKAPPQLMGEDHPS